MVRIFLGWRIVHDQRLVGCNVARNRAGRRPEMQVVSVAVEHQKVYSYDCIETGRNGQGRRALEGLRASHTAKHRPRLV